MTHIAVKISWDTTQFPEFTFCVPHIKPHGVWGLIKHYNICLDPKLGHGKCEIQWITCACVACTNILYNAWDPGDYCVKQPPRYHPVVEYK